MLVLLLIINDVARLVSNPDPGAIEFANAPCGGVILPGTGSVSPSTPVCAGTHVILSVANQTIGGGITYQWLSSSTSGGTYTPVSGVLNYPDFEFNAPSTTTFYKLAVTCAGNTVTGSPVELIVKQPLNGVYTINMSAPTDIITGGTNFASFADASNFLTCGIAGPVTFNVTPGTYNEQLLLDQISGTSATNTIRFNGNAATISFTSANTNERGIIKLNGTDYVTIDNLIIEATGTTTSQYGYGVHLLNDADYNTISNCTINITTTPATVSSTSYAGIIVNSSASGTATTTGDTRCDFNTFTGNTITGGNTGISLIANSGTAMIHGNKVTNNVINDFYTNGIHLNGNNNAIIENNNLGRASRPNGGEFRGINMESVNLNTMISRNSIHDPFGSIGTTTVAAYGIRLSSVDATVNNENVISNNMIYNFIGSTGTHNGILVNSSDHGKYYFNSIRLDDASASAGNTRGLYVQATAVAGLDIRNNIFSIGRGGSGEKQAIYFEPTSVASYTINNNDYHNFASGGTVEIAHIGGTGGTGYPTLAGWQAATSKDGNSMDVDPMFVSSTDLHLQPASTLKDKGVQIASVSIDIDGTVRAPTPVIGADEFGTLPPTTYVFIGSGNWDVAANWLNGAIPPSTLPSGSEIYINPSGSATLNVPVTIASGGKLTVISGKPFVIQGNLTIQ